MSELTVILKDSDRTYKQKFLIYEKYSVSTEESIIRACVEEAKKAFQDEPETIQVKIHLEMQ